MPQLSLSKPRHIIILGSAAAAALLCNLAFTGFALLLILLLVLGSTYPESTAIPEGYFELVGFSAICGAPLSAASLVALTLRRRPAILLALASAAALALILFATISTVFDGSYTLLDFARSELGLPVALSCLGFLTIALLIGVAVERMGRRAQRSSA